MRRLLRRYRRWVGLRACRRGDHVWVATVRHLGVCRPALRGNPMSAVLDPTDTARAQRDRADIAVLERARELMAERGGVHLRREDIHQAERELDHRLTIAAR